MNKSLVAVLFLIFTTFFASVLIYPSLPDSITTHWNFAGQPNGYMSKTIGAFFIPLLSLFLLGLFLLIPRIDPLKKNIKEFRKFFDSFIVVFTFFMSYIHILILLWNINFFFNMSTAIIPAMGLLFFYLGSLLKHSKRNWFIGIRTPWTLSSDKVWEKTNRLGCIIFKICGALTLLSLFIKKDILLMMIIPLIACFPVLVVYSYLEFKKEQVKK